MDNVLCLICAIVCLAFLAFAAVLIRWWLEWLAREDDV